MHVVLVKEQKSKYSGKPAPIVFSNVGFEVLKYYLNDLLPKFCGDKFTDLVFPRIEKKCSKRVVACPLSFKEHFTILQRKELNGKKLSSRAVRGSLVTINRETNASIEVQKDLADSMSHSLPVANS